MHDELAVSKEVIGMLKDQLDKANERIRALEAVTVGPLRELRWFERRNARLAGFTHAVDLVGFRRGAPWATELLGGTRIAAAQLTNLLADAGLPAAISWADVGEDGKDLVRYHARTLPLGEARHVAEALKPFDGRTLPHPRAVQRKVEYSIAVLG